MRDVECATACDAQEFVKDEIMPWCVVCAEVGARKDIVTMWVTVLTALAAGDAIKDGEWEAKAELQGGDEG